LLGSLIVWAVTRVYHLDLTQRICTQLLNRLRKRRRRRRRRRRR
jgi:hypothetical protein